MKNWEWEGRFENHNEIQILQGGGVSIIEYLLFM